MRSDTSDSKIEDLIEELKALRVRETAIIREIEAANELRILRASSNTTEGRDTNDAEAVPKQAVPNRLQVGDRVRITNKIRRPATATATWTEQLERIATVTRVTVEQIHIVTGNGTRTWRAPNNLKKQG